MVNPMASSSRRDERQPPAGDDAGGLLLLVLVARQEHPGPDGDHGGARQVVAHLADSAGQGGAQPQPDDRHSAFEGHKDERDAQPLPPLSAWLAPIAAATAKESRPSGSTKASSFSTDSGSHVLSSRGRDGLPDWAG